MQVAAGAEILMLFDTWANQLPTTEYAKLVLPRVARIIKALRGDGVPMIYYPGQGSDQLHELKGLATDVISIDWRVPMDRAIGFLKAQGLDVTVQGNLDPHALLGTRESVREKVADVLARAEGARSHIFNVGHGLLPYIPPEALGWAIEEVRAYRPSK